MTCSNHYRSVRIKPTTTLWNYFPHREFSIDRWAMTDFRLQGPLTNLRTRDNGIDSRHPASRPSVAPPLADTGTHSCKPSNNRRKRTSALSTPIRYWERSATACAGDASSASNTHRRYRRVTPPGRSGAHQVVTTATRTWYTARSRVVATPTRVVTTYDSTSKTIAARAVSLSWYIRQKANHADDSRAPRPERAALGLEPKIINAIFDGNSRIPTVYHGGRNLDVRLS